ncbi:MFS transporter [Scopulibacillus cellulosilyticus]|uniref:MFS transporter n=1 Tax=Scopulibacillus cellulosilyticus TaxID=2665665 RepID=A0ABW2PTW1_9BACL
MKTVKAKIIYTIVVYIALAAFDNIIIGLFPPLFKSIAKDLHTNVSSMGIISALNILVTALSSLYWGYLSGKFKRKRLIFIGTLIWVLSVFLTALSRNYIELLLFQILTGIGLGCIASVGFSVLTDCIPSRMRGMILSLWGMTQGLGGIAGSLLASLIAPSAGWRTPFYIVGCIGFLLIILYIFVAEPPRGGSEPELQGLMKEGYSYNYIIETKQILPIILKGSNRYLFLQAFLFNIAIGSLIWLPTLYIFKIQQEGYAMGTAMAASGYLYGIFQLGGTISMLFGNLGDKLQKKNRKGRAYLSSVFVFLTIPFYILMFIVPMTNLSLPAGHNAFFILIGLVKQILTNPWITLLFILSFLASAAQSANTPNWLALITDVNLPEHRGTAFSVANLSNSLGRSLGNIGVSILISVFSIHLKEPYSYIITLSLLQIFLIPSALCYIKMAKHNVSDIHRVKETLIERSEKD